MSKDDFNKVMQDEDAQLKKMAEMAHDYIQIYEDVQRAKDLLKEIGDKYAIESDYIHADGTFVRNVLEVCDNIIERYYSAITHRKGPSDNR